MIRATLHKLAGAAKRADFGYAFLQFRPGTMDAHAQSILTDRKVSGDRNTRFLLQIQSCQQFDLRRLQFFQGH